MEISSRDNPRVKRWRALVTDARARDREKRVLIEGEHLVAAFLDSGGKVAVLILGKSAASRFGELAKRSALTPVVLTDAVFKAIADTGTPAGIAAEIALPAPDLNLKSAPSCVFLEGIQDAGNVGAILRSAAAFGVRHAALGVGCADAWSSKVLRAGMGAHFAMTITERVDLAVAIGEFAGKIACAVPRDGVALPAADLAGRIGWIFGAEGQGITPALAAYASQKVTIPMPGGAESLNVAASAAICFYEMTRSRGKR